MAGTEDISDANIAIFHVREHDRFVELQRPGEDWGDSPAA